MCSTSMIGGSTRGSLMRPISKTVIYRLEGKNENDISPIWQILQVFFYAASINLGFFICWLFTQALELTKSHCVLYADLFMTNAVMGKVRQHNVSCSVDILQPTVRWNHCDVVLMITVVTTTAATFLMVMFVYCGRGGAGNPSMPDTWRIIIPTIVTNLTICILAIYSAADFTLGVLTFKANLQRAWQLNETDFDLGEIRCLRVEDDEIGRELGGNLYLLKEFMYLWVSFWAMGVFWIVVRCMFGIDFQLVRTTIYEYPRTPNVRPIIYRRSDDDESLLRGSGKKSVKFTEIGDLSKLRRSRKST